MRSPAQRLNGSTNEKYGLARSLSVMPGDKINIEVFAKYVDPNSTNWTGVLPTLMSQIAASTAGVVIDGAGYGTSTSTFPFPTQATANTSGSSEPGPEAYLNWLVFDKNYVLLTGGFDRLSTGAREFGQDVAHERLFSPEVLITEPGFVYIFLSNEETTPLEVYFDDFKVDHIKSPVIQSDDYYAFGLTFNSYQRENSTENRYLYNQGTGAKTFKTERVFDLGLGVDMTKFRVYDPAIGKWWQIDPIADEEDFTSWSPYNYSFNNPVSYNDPYGDTPITPILRKLGQMGVKWAARTVKGGIKPVSRKQAVKILENKGTVYQAEKGSNKVAKKLMQEAKPDKKIVRHDGHKLDNGKTGMDHYQPKAGDGSHVNYVKSTAAAGATVATGSATEANAEANSTQTQANVNSVDIAVQVIGNATPQGAQINAAANAGKLILDNNAVGNFIDNWVNPFGLAKDVMDLAILGTIAIDQK